MINTAKKRLFRWLLAMYKRRALRLANTDFDHCLGVIRGMFKRGQFGFLTTHGLNGWPSSRLVQPIVELNDDKFEIWIGTKPDLRKVLEVKADGRVTFSIEDRRQQANLVVYGVASIVEQPALKRRFWKGEWRLFFPDGPNSDSYVLIRIDPCRIELLNFGKHVVEEPFGLKPVILEKRGKQWAFA